MTPFDSWTCDGIPKNGKQYPDIKPEKHEPEKNYASDCAICGLPKEAMDLVKSGGGSLLKKPILTAAVIGSIILAGGGIAYTLIAQGCDQGLHKIDGQCVDLYLQTYEESKQQGDQAVNLANNYQSIEDLEKAQLSLDAVFNQLNQIPQDAPIYGKAQSQLQIYESQPVKIAANLQKEIKAQQELAVAKAIASDAAKKTATANSTSQLNSLKEKWQEAQTKLQAIANDTLLASQIQQLQTEYEQKITDIEDRITSLAKQSLPLTQTTSTEVIPKFTPRPTVQPKSTPRTTVQPKSKSQPTGQPPSDPCAVQNPPPNCLF